MKVPLSWLKGYVATAFSVREIAQKLTMAGIEVKGVESVGGQWDNILVGQIKAVNPHPNADRLRLVTVDLGTEEGTVVCGAPNCRVGDKIAFARVGAELIDGHTGERVRLKPARIRGVVSSGMVCSEKELGVSDNHEGIMVLPSNAPVGMPLSLFLGDAILNLEVTPNRPDCLSVIGIAREVSALTGASLQLPEISYEEETAPAGQQVAVEIRAPDLCPRYCASVVTGVNVTDSPAWMQHRLLACGMRPINNIVDITNYVMLEYGQPLHAFDYTLIRGGKIVVRRANPGEKITTLDGMERALSANTLVIADAERSVAVAGVMGGANSEVAPETTSVLLEAASFNPASIHYTGRALGLPSEACMRFERGISPELTVPALRRATQLLVQLCGGKAARGWVDVYPVKREVKPIALPTAEVKRILGVDFSLDQIVDTLVSLGFDCHRHGVDEALVMPPYWRTDIRLAVDLIEEIARIAGYDQIPTTMLSQALPAQNQEPIVGLKRRVRNIVASYGFQEVITYSLTSLEMLKALAPESRSSEPPPLRISNPMTVEQEYLRPHLRAGLLTALSANRKFEEAGIRLFEVGRAYLRRDKSLPEEREMLCAVLSGPRAQRSWHGNEEPMDFFDAKGLVEGLLSQLGIEASFEPGSDASLHSSRQAAVVVSGEKLGVVGELHPAVLQNYEIPGATYLLEISLAALLPFALGRRVFQPIPRFPAVVRDMALVVSTAVTHHQVVDVIEGFPLVTRVALFDVYSGRQVPEGKKSLAYRVTFQSPGKTLTDKEVDTLFQQIVDELSRALGAALRG